MTIPNPDATPRLKLIEVALPLEAINNASIQEKNNPFLKGHPRGLHQWWSRKPLATARAVLFASLVDDPSCHPETFPTEAEQDEERQRLFRLIEELVKWENTTNEKVLDAARQEILRSTDGNPPPVLDPFAGGGSIPLEAQRLGLKAHASDLNPVAVLINKALIEIPPKFAGRSPVNPNAQKKTIKRADWRGAQGLVEDVRYYGKWMRDEAERRIGHLYPKASLPDGTDATVVAWLWVRTVQCPNPACGARMPLTSKWMLSTKKGKEAYAQPIIDRSQTPPQVKFEVREGKDAPEPPKTGRGAKFKCLVCQHSASDEHIKNEGKSKRLGAQLMAVVAEGKRGRAYLSPTQNQEEAAKHSQPTWEPDLELAKDPRNLWCVPYGLKTFGDLFTARQLVALTTLGDLVQEARDEVLQDAETAGLPEGESLEAGGRAARAYADAVAIYLALLVDKVADYSNALCTWNTTNQNITHLFTKQAIPMSWDYVEANPLYGGISPENLVDGVMQPVTRFSSTIEGESSQIDASKGGWSIGSPMVSTDPPYYDSIGYADLSDFFYVWLRKTLINVLPSVLGTLTTPKLSELVATPYRFDGSKEAAKDFFESGFQDSFKTINGFASNDFPITVYYAFKQAETSINRETSATSVSSTGWETMLEGLLAAGFQVRGTWPIRTERSARSTSQGNNSLASSIVFVCRPRSNTAPTATRREFLTALRRELPDAMRNLQQGSIAPVDLAQAAIGPGMAVYSRYSEVLESDGKAMPVRTALSNIIGTLDEVLTEQEGEFDADTRWALVWFEQHGVNDGPFGDAETLSKAKNTSVSGMVKANIVKSGGNKVRLLSRRDLPVEWDPLMDDDVPVWEATQHLVKRLEEGGEEKAAALLAQLGSTAEIARDLAYRLYSLCERKKWAQEALAYNALVSVWPELTKLAANLPEAPRQAQGSMFGDD